VRDDLAPLSLEGAQVFQMRRPNQLPSRLGRDTRGVIVGVQQLVHEQDKLGIGLSVLSHGTPIIDCHVGGDGGSSSPGVRWRTGLSS
jgi:hypothetical protein